MKKYTAYCSSSHCAGIAINGLNSTRFKIKDVSFSAIDCPDCGCSLRWIKDNKKVKTVKNKKIKQRNIDFNLNNK